ncbi:MAG: hypothetical protein JJ899_12970 [Alphaproteobacteria bacterium]|nr:hypothetical protein [Alphaproteobacteria bacterium]
MNAQPSQFVLKANPHAWLLSADNLHTAACSTYDGRGFGSIQETSASSEKLIDLVEKPAFLLAGFAIENLLKAFLVYENPNWISNGSLAKELRTHSLSRLHAKSALLIRKDGASEILAEFEDGLDSWARYPCALSEARTKEQRPLPPSLWQSYRELMFSCGRQMVSLLEKGWVGPDGFEARFSFEGDFLSILQK